ncbi:hypothetical protein MKY95_21160 [Paenibacillus sp. FSL P4-0176]|uniref:BC1872 family protein n=1 Tax=Paenibacillus sp. FSL P4-0176 TaxID=2921631 RepID=UPI0030CDE4A3
MTQIAEVTKELILGMIPCRELDALVGKCVVKENPEIKWYAMNKEETVIHQDFNYQSEADEWLEFDKKHGPERGLKIVRRELYSKYSEDMFDAWAVEERIVELRLQAKYCESLKRVVVGTGEYVGMFDYIHATPAQRCKAALLAVLDL